PASFCIKEGAILCAGAKILGKGQLTVGRNTIIAANAVLLSSTGDNEVWAGIPAKKIKDRERIR
ncbi:MAG: acyltransferase, partial [Thomasclavelia spiroformis]